MSDLPQKPISILKVLLWLVVGLVIGGIVGAGGGIALTMALTAFSVAINPDDPTAGSVAIIIIGLLPGGALFGAAVGAVLALKLNGVRLPDVQASDVG